jgi:hypothetical protein
LGDVVTIEREQVVGDIDRIGSAARDRVRQQRPATAPIVGAEE